MAIDGQRDWRHGGLDADGEAHAEIKRLLECLCRIEGADETMYEIVNASARDW